MIKRRRKNYRVNQNVSKPVIIVVVIGVQRLSVIVPKEERRVLPDKRVAEPHEEHVQHLPVPADSRPDKCASVLQEGIDHPRQGRRQTRGPRST